MRKVKWVPHFKTDLHTEEEVGGSIEEPIGTIEYSIIRQTYLLGFQSWGWDGDYKIILFKADWDKNKDKSRRDLVNSTAAALNKKQL